MPPSATSISTQTVHADDALNTLPPSLGVELQDVAPALHVSTTFRYSRDPEQLKEVNEVDVGSFQNYLSAELLQIRPAQCRDWDWDWDWVRDLD
jgi:hypothetical protein